MKLGARRMFYGKPIAAAPNPLPHLANSGGHLEHRLLEHENATSSAAMLCGGVNRMVSTFTSISRGSDSGAGRHLGGILHAL